MTGKWVMPLLTCSVSPLPLLATLQKTTECFIIVSKILTNFCRANIKTENLNIFLPPHRLTVPQNFKHHTNVRTHICTFLMFQRQAASQIKAFCQLLSCAGTICDSDGYLFKWLLNGVQCPNNLAQQRKASGTAQLLQLCLFSQAASLPHQCPWAAAQPRECYIPILATLCTPFPHSLTECSQDPEGRLWELPLSQNRYRFLPKCLSQEVIFSSRCTAVASAHLIAPFVLCLHCRWYTAVVLWCRHLLQGWKAFHKSPLWEAVNERILLLT